MKKYAFRRILFFLIPFLSFSLFGAEEPKYTNESFGRLSYLSGSAYIQKGAELGFEEAVINMPIEEGDRLGTTEGRAEIYLGKKNYVRLDNNTKLDFLNLPAKNADLTRLRVLAGNIYLSVNRLEKEKTIEVHTADSSFYFLDEGLYRIDVSEKRKTAILVFHGLVEAAGEEGSLLLKSEQSLEAADGRFTSKPRRFFAVAEDAFDRWSEFRESHIRTEVAKRYLPDELEDFEKELAEHGEWTYIAPHGWVWVPGGVDPDWRPYYNGRWIWLSLGGWTWLPYEPWGWATFHYGRWHWGPGFGWYWIPGSIWSPAWVWWYWGYDYFGWAPLSWWGYPVVILDGRFYGRYYGPYYPYNSRALTVIHKNQLKARNVSSVALKGDSLKTLDKITLSSQAPDIRPGPEKITAQKIGENKTAERRFQPRWIDTRQQAAPAPEERRIRRKDTPQGTDADMARAAGAGRAQVLGYPPSPEISVKRFSERSISSRSSTLRSRLYRYLQGDRSTSRSTSPRASISGSSSSASRGRGSVSSAPRSSSSAARSSSSGSSGRVSKKD